MALPRTKTTIQIVFIQWHELENHKGTEQKEEERNLQYLNVYLILCIVNEGKNL